MIVAVRASELVDASGLPARSHILLVVFTLAQIEDLHAQFGRADSLPDYLRGLAAIGIVRYESFVADGHSEFFGANAHRVVSPAYHDALAVADVSDRSTFLEHLRRHGDGATSYLEMSAGLAASGVEKWVADTDALTLTYRDRAGTALLVERLGQPVAVPPVIALTSSVPDRGVTRLSTSYGPWCRMAPASEASIIGDI